MFSLSGGSTIANIRCVSSTTKGHIEHKSFVLRRQHGLLQESVCACRTVNNMRGKQWIGSWKKHGCLMATWTYVSSVRKIDIRLFSTFFSSFLLLTSIPLYYGKCKHFKAFYFITHKLIVDISFNKIHEV